MKFSFSSLKEQLRFLLESFVFAVSIGLFILFGFSDFFIGELYSSIDRNKWETIEMAHMLGHPEPAAGVTFTIIFWFLLYFFFRNIYYFLKKNLLVVDESFKTPKRDKLILTSLTLVITLILFYFSLYIVTLFF